MQQCWKRHCAICNKWTKLFTSKLQAYACKLSRKLFGSFLSGNIFLQQSGHRRFIMLTYILISVNEVFAKYRCEFGCMEKRLGNYECYPKLLLFEKFSIGFHLYKKFKK